MSKKTELAEARDLLETAWGIIANAGWNGEEKTTGWQPAAVSWRDDYFAWCRKNMDRMPQEGPDARRGDPDPLADPLTGCMPVTA